MAQIAPVGIDGDQAIDLAHKTCRKFVTEILRGSLVAVRAEPKFWKEYRSGIYRDIGQTIIAGTTGLGILFIARNAEVLKAFVEQIFQSPALIQLVELIAKLGS